MLKKKHKGFTLAELLIVVAIIAILVAISLPLFSSQIAKANLQADQTHVSAAKASAVAEYLDTNSHDTITYYFDAGIAMAIRIIVKVSLDTERAQKNHIKNKLVQLVYLSMMMDQRISFKLLLETMEL